MVDSQLDFGSAKAEKSSPELAVGPPGAHDIHVRVRVWLWLGSQAGSWGYCYGGHGGRVLHVSRH